MSRILRSASVSVININRADESHTRKKKVTSLDRARPCALNLSLQRKIADAPAAEEVSTTKRSRKNAETERDTGELTVNSETTVTHNVQTTTPHKLVKRGVSIQSIGHALASVRRQVSSSAKQLIGAKGRSQTLKSAAELDDVASQRQFGVDIEQLYHREESTRGVLKSHTPLLASLCIGELRSRGARTKGIFRLAAANDEVQYAKNEIEKQGVSEALFAKMDIHVVAQLLKLFVRQVPRTLLGSEANVHTALSAVKRYIDAPHQLQAFVDTMRTLIANLGAVHRDTLRDIFALLSQLASEHADVTSMDASNLATCFGPTLVDAYLATHCPPPPSPRRAVDNADAEALKAVCAASNKLVELLICEFEKVCVCFRCDVCGRKSKP
jgi:hypothetical protein